jgi:hypothetical protein
VIAALFVAANGCYFGLDGIDPWDEKRDARLYPGPYPVVAHPPCSRWCRLAGLVEARWGHKRGDDGGCFASALASVRKWGGVLEHPAYSDAWAAFDIPPPSRHGGWMRDTKGGWSTHVEQVATGTPQRRRRGSTRSDASCRHCDGARSSIRNPRRSSAGAEIICAASRTIGRASSRKQRARLRSSFENY